MNIHKAYVDVGADILECNTFGANPLKLAQFGLADATEKINIAGVTAARRAAKKGVEIAGNIGPSGRLIAPLGDLNFDEACESYARQIKALAGAGVDYILFETIIDLQEMRAGVLAAKAICNLPIICQLTYDAMRPLESLNLMRSLANSKYLFFNFLATPLLVSRTTAA